MGDLTKQDDLLKKAVVPKRSSDRRSQGSSAGTSGNRSRSPDNRSRRNYGNSGKGANKRNYKGKPGGSSAKKARPENDSEDDAPQPKSKNKSGGAKGKNAKKGEFPSSFSQAWPAFFSATAMLMVASVGLVLDYIPTLNSLPLGGRLRHCVQNWRIICDYFCLGLWGLLNLVTRFL